MKNAAVCARCGARLVWNEKIRREDFHPPRLSAWEKIRRRADRTVFRQRRRRRGGEGFLSLFARVPDTNRIWGLASVVPGLGHLVRGECRKGALLAAGWAAAGALLAIHHADRLLFRGGRLLNPGALVAVAALAIMALLHGYALFDALRPGDFCRTAGEARAVMLATIVAILLLYGVSTILFW